MIKTLLKNGFTALLLFATITGCTEDNDGVTESGVTELGDVTVTGIKVTGVTISQTSLEMAIKDTYTLTAEVTPYNATNRSVAWTSSNSAVATVDGAGNVVAWSEGTTIISAVTTDVDYVANCTIVVIADESDDDDDGDDDNAGSGSSGGDDSAKDNSEDMEQGTGFGN